MKDDRIEIIEDLMHIGLVIFVIIVILLWAFVRKMVQNNGNNKIEETISNEKIEEKTEMEEIFFEEVKNGEKTKILTNTLDQFDLTILKSLFQSEQIPYHIEFKHITSVYPFLNSATAGSEIFYILEKDYNDVVKLIEEYRRKENS